MHNPFATQNSADRITLTSVYALADAGHLDPSGFRRALQLSGNTPTVAQAWQIAHNLLLVFGTALVLMGVIFAVAYNWDYLTALLGSWGKFAAMQVLVAATFGFALYRGIDTPLGRIALVATIVLIGPLLALFGQTYQTGADTFTLFTTWAGLALAWVVASRNAAAWLLWIIILQTALVSYIFSHFGWLGMLLGWFTGWLMVVLTNAALLVLWEAAASRVRWLQSGASFSASYAPRLIAWVLTALLTVVTCAWIVLGMLHGSDPTQSAQQSLGVGALLWLLALGLGYWRYRPRKDLFMLTGGLVSLLIVALVLVGRLFFSGGNFGAGLLFFPVMAGMVFFYTSWARRWLKRVQGQAA
jgi:uncharacterized membrane protein